MRYSLKDVKHNPVVHTVDTGKGSIEGWTEAKTTIRNSLAKTTTKKAIIEAVMETIVVNAREGGYLFVSYIFASLYIYTSAILHFRRVGGLDEWDEKDPAVLLTTLIGLCKPGMICKLHCRVGPLTV
jgi:hypothetical protein